MSESGSRRPFPRREPRYRYNICQYLRRLGNTQRHFIKRLNMPAILFDIAGSRNMYMAIFCPPSHATQTQQNMRAVRSVGGLSWCLGRTKNKTRLGVCKHPMPCIERSTKVTQRISLMLQHPTVSQARQCISMHRLTARVRRCLSRLDESSHKRSPPMDT